MAKNDIGAGALLVAFVAGAIAGAAVAVLYAPAAGEDTREYLGRRAREESDRARRNITTAFDKAREQYQNLTGEPESEA